MRLAALIRRESDALLLQWRTQVRQLPAATHLDIPTLNDHVPALIEELAKALETTGESPPEEEVLGGSPPIHSIQRFKNGFDLIEVVEEYNILRSCIQELAESNGLIPRGKILHILNHVFDEAIGVAVQTFSTQQAIEVQRRRDEHLAFVVHDLRTPLTAISLSAKALEASLPENNEKTGQMLAILRRNAQRLEALVEKVLKESAQIETLSLVRREFDLWPLVEALIHDLQPVAETAGTGLVNEIPKGMIAYADASMLKRIFQNLIANAIKYSPRGEVIISAKEIGKGGIECRVSDNGVGIPKDRLEKIFDKGETGQERNGESAAGFGLPIVKMLVEAHGGKVTVRSKEGAGSTFLFTLPLK